MPVGKKQQSNVMLGALVASIILFIVSLTAAVILYVNFEKQRDIALDSQSKLEEVATSSDQRQFGSVARGKTVLGSANEYIGQLTTSVIGSQSEESTSEVNFETASKQAGEILETLSSGYIEFTGEDANSIGLVRALEKMKVKLDSLGSAFTSKSDDYDKLQKRFDSVLTESQAKEQALLEEKQGYQSLVEKVTGDYKQLQETVKSSSEERVQILMEDLSKEEDRANGLYKDLLKTQAQLKMTQTKLGMIQSDLEKIVPDPEKAVAAFDADGKIILIDEANKIVHVDLGSNDGVYRGLMFSVYDRSVPITNEGQGKAEIKVFDVQKDISLAKVIYADEKNPIVFHDNIANLIWETDQQNVFLVTGEFDLNNDGRMDYEGMDKIKALIQKWGGGLTNEVTVDTDFVVMGREPMVLSKPTFEMLEVDPMAMEKYEKAIQLRTDYDDIKKQAAVLGVPVLNLERFLYFTGYHTESVKPGAFD